ncbi:MAG: outer membrane protein assembly factor BamA [Vicingaceae bacterium]
MGDLFRTAWLILSLLIVMAANAQVAQKLSYTSPKKYEIGGVTVKGADFFDHNALKSISGLRVGKEIEVPGKEVSEAIKNLWNQKLFSDIKISIDRIEGRYIYLFIDVKTMPRLSKFKITGVKKGDVDDIRESIQLIRGKVLTEDVLIETQNKIRKFYVDKGRLNAEVEISQESDTTLNNHVILNIRIKKNKRVKIHDVIIKGNKSIKEKKLRKVMKNTKQNKGFTPLSTSKFKRPGYEIDKKALIKRYQEEGFRDARILRDTVIRKNAKRINVSIEIEEGRRYYFRDIRWIGNTKYKTETLNKILGIEKGDVYNQKLMEQRLQQDPKGRDISTLYLDDGYLFFNVTPVEVMVDGDSIDFEIRIYEGRQARINRVWVSGNTKTNDHVIMREVRTVPGNLFSRSDIMRTHRELAQLNYFDPEKANQNITPDPENGTVDIEYIVEEKPSDQIELSGGWGGGQIVGTLGLSFNNFSARNFFKKGAWNPLPSGDGQRLSLRAQTSGPIYQFYSMSFTEPWLGGRKRNSLTVSFYHQVSTNGQRKTISDELGNEIRNPNRQALLMYGVSVGLGKQLQWPDDYFSWYNEVSYQYYILENWNQFFFTNGISKNLSFKTEIARNSIDAPIYPRTGSRVSLGLEFTPPWSMVNDVDYTTATIDERYEFVEFHKWTFKVDWYNRLAGDLVLNTKFGYGFLGFYNKDLGQSPFERFYVGGDGLSGGINLESREIVGMRGFENQQLSAQGGSSIVSKYTVELRYPLTLNPTATIYGLTFAEAGNAWERFADFRPFAVYKSVGFGVRIFMPMFGLLGIDYAWRLDEIPGVTNPNKRGIFHFTIGGNLGGW